MDLITPAVGLIVWMIIIFGVLFFLLRMLAWKPILSALKEREDSIDSALRMAEETRAEMAKLKSDNEKTLAEARLERDKIIKEARNAAEKVVADAKEKGEGEKNRIIADAREAMLQEKTAIVAQMKKDVTALSVEIAEKIIRKELSDKKAQQTLVSDFISEAKFN